MSEKSYSARARALAHWPFALVIFLCVLCTRAPQASEPGYEYGLLAGLLLPWLVGGLSARAEQGVSSSAGQVLLRALVYAAVVFIVPVLCTFGSQPCDLAGGMIWVGSGASLGSGCASVVGSLVGGTSRTAARAFWLGAMPPLASVALGLARFWATPSVHAYDAFAGYFAGTLYDTVIPFDARYAWSRALPLVLVAVLALTPPRWRLGALGVALLLLSAEPHFGLLHHSPGALASRLPERRDGACVVHADTHIPAARVDALLRQCEVDKRDVEAYFGVAQVPVTVFVFRDAEQKQRLMGAGHTYIAKPWRNEVYVQDAGFPHPTLRHEIAHVITSAFASGPFRVGGSLGGFLPDPGRIEGFAVAAEGESASRRERVADMRNAGVMPTVSQVFSLGFLNAPGARSYTFAGAFVDDVNARYGAATLRAWYGGADLALLVGKPWPVLEQEFVTGLPAGEPAHNDDAKARYGGPGILARRCPHRIDGLRADASRCVAAGDVSRARALIAEARLLAPSDAVLQYEDARLAAEGDAAASMYLQSLLEDGRAEPALRSAAHELLGDRSRDNGRFSAEANYLNARAHYDKAASFTPSEDRKRLLEIKREALAWDAAPALRNRFMMPRAPAASAPAAERGWSEYFGLKDALRDGKLAATRQLGAHLRNDMSVLSVLAQAEAKRMLLLVDRYAFEPAP